MAIHLKHAARVYYTITGIDFIGEALFVRFLTPALSMAQDTIKVECNLGDSAGDSGDSIGDIVRQAQTAIETMFLDGIEDDEIPF